VVWVEGFDSTVSNHMPSFITDFVSKKGAKIVRGKLFPRMACGKQLASQFE
jgi:hypothetical protein